MTAPTSTLPTGECTCCTHPQAAEIDAALLGGTTVRVTAETFGVSRSAVGRHRVAHLSAEAIEQADDDQRRPLTLVDVHGELGALAERLEQVIELSARTRKPAAAVTAMRELRQTLEAIARLQADPVLARAASAAELQRAALDGSLGFVLACVHELLRVAGLKGQEWHRLLAAFLRTPDDDGVMSAARLGAVDTAEVRALQEKAAVEASRRAEAEVARRVEAELRRRDAGEQRPSAAVGPGPERLAIEAGGSPWS